MTLPTGPREPHFPFPPILILASASPRRRDLLAQTGLTFTVLPADVDETPIAGMSPAQLALSLARRKAAHVAAQHPHAVVLGADTVVDCNGQVLGKPRDQAEAIAMLGLLQGGTHAVHTGIALAGRTINLDLARVISSLVTMCQVNEASIAAYVATGEPMDKAGAYALQGGAAAWITEVRGSRTGVVGLPLAETLALLAEAGIRPPPV